METKSSILGNQLVVMSKSDLDTMVNEMAQSIVAAHTPPTCATPESPRNTSPR